MSFVSVPGPQKKLNYENAGIALLTLFKITGGHKLAFWNGSGTLPPLPEVFVDVQEVSLELQTTQLENDLSKGFRMLYSFHEVGLK